MVPGVLCGRCREVQPCLAVSDRILTKVKGNGNRILDMEDTRPNNQLNLGYLQQFGRAA